METTPTPNYNGPAYEGDPGIDVWYPETLPEDLYEIWDIFNPASEAEFQARLAGLLDYVVAAHPELAAEAGLIGGAK